MSAARGVTSSRIAAARQQLDARPVELVDDLGGNADVGDDDVAGARLGRAAAPAAASAPPSVTVMPASIESPIGSCESADRPDGRSIATTGMPERVDVGDDRLEQAATAARSGPVPKIASTISVQSLTSEKCSSHAWLSAISTTVRPRRPRISRFDARVAADVGDAADQEHRHVDAALHQRARDDEAVAAVVAAAAQHGDLPLEQVAVDRLHRRDHLPAGVLHQHERRDADLLDRPAIGLAHLRGVQDSHRRASKDQHEGIHYRQMAGPARS